MSALRRQSGQATTLAVVFLVGLLGMAALVVDFGSWFRASRAAQAAADAAVLAGAQALPESPDDAKVLALRYADDNGGGLSGENVLISDDLVPNDTITVRIEREAPGFFARVFGVSIVDVGGKARARASVPAEAKWAAPIAVDMRHPLLSGSGCPCWNVPTEIDSEKVGPGAFRLVNLDRSMGGVGPQDLYEWIVRGYDGFMPLDWYLSDPGFKPSSSWVKDGLEARIGDEILLPVYRGTRKQGANFAYEVIGWVGYHVTDYKIKGSKEGVIFGWFTRIIWEGIQGESSPGSSDFGVRTITLLE